MVNIYSAIYSNIVYQHTASVDYLCNLFEVQFSFFNIDIVYGYKKNKGYIYDFLISE